MSSSYQKWELKKDIYTLCIMFSAEKDDIWFMFQVLRNWASPSINENRKHKSLRPVCLVWGVCERRQLFWYMESKNTLSQFLLVCVCVFFFLFAQFKEQEWGDLLEQSVVIVCYNRVTSSRIHMKGCKIKLACEFCFSILLF